MPEFRTDADTEIPAEILSAFLTESDSAFSPEDVQEFFTGYVTTLLWTATWESDTGDAPEGYDNESITLTEEELATLTADVFDFLSSNAKHLGEYVARGRSMGDAGHDFALTRNGHGAGFWDRGLGVLGDRLSDASKRYGECNISAYVEDDEISISF